MSTVLKYPFLIYLLKFIGIFSILYYGTIAFIGLAAPGGRYVPFFDHYLDYVSGLRSSLLFGCKGLLSIIGIETSVKDIYTLQIPNGRGVHIGYDCLGYGVMSFWIAFIIANEGDLKRKIAWILSGVILIWIINIIRISTLLIAINKKWPNFPGFDHHTWFNIAAYTCIFTGIYFYDQSAKKRSQKADG